MNTPIFKNVTLSATYAPLNSASLVCDFVLVNPTGNDAVYLEATVGSGDVTVAAGEWYEFKRCDLAAINIKGTADQTVRVIGHTAYP